MTGGQPTRNGAPALPWTLTVRSVGGPTAILELGGVRLVTDPTFDPPGTYPVGQRVLTKLEGPAIGVDDVGWTDAVLLSHHQHPDNLDHSGREFLARVPLVITTGTASDDLGPPARELGYWEQLDIHRRDGGIVRVTGVPARHGPSGSEQLTGEVMGFVISGLALPTVYVSGDNASLEIVEEVGERLGPIDVAVLFAGGARTPLLGDAYLTLTSAMAAEAARILDVQSAVPIHWNSWGHFTEGRDTLRPAFRQAGVPDRLVLLDPGETALIESE